MVTAIVLMNTEGGQVARIAREIGQIPDVTEVLSTAGAYDLVAKVQVQEYEHMSEVITERLQGVEGIVNTETLMAFHTYKF
ncbi:MAG: Lrp/AsnC ligand binding domain-containing protein [Thermoleophilia bacterium]|nr:Lrp/AsnC ligand binding domain-containing protein [Thermoleophilia bacterium]